jgi:hypothetical protein
LTRQDSFIASLLELSMQPLPAKELRRIGPEPLKGDPDTRQIWKPSFTLNGQKVPSVEFDVFRAIWPGDGSDLAGNTVDLYFDKNEQSPFPAWIQITAAHATASLPTIGFCRAVFLSLLMSLKKQRMD